MVESIANVRKNYPEFSDLSDSDFAEAMHSEHYADVPKEVFFKEIGLQETKKPQISKEGGLHRLAEYAQQKINEPSRALAEGALQGALNVGPGLANLIPGVNIKKFDFAPENAFATIGEIGGSIPAFGGITKAVGALPHVQQAFAGAKNILHQLPGMTPKRANAIADLMSSIGQNALFGAAEHSENQLAGAGVGAALGAAGRGVGAIINKLKGRAQRNALKDLERVVTPEGLARKGEAESELGLSLSPAEAMATPQARAFEEQVGRTKKGQEYLHEAESRRAIQEPKAIKDTLEEIYPKKIYEELEKPLFEKAKKEKIPNKDLLELAQHAGLGEAATDMLNNKKWRRLANEYKTNDIGFYATLKEYMQNVLRPSIKKAEGPKGTVRLIDEDIKFLTNKLTDASPTYKEALKVSQPRFARKEIEAPLRKTAFNAKNINKVLGNEAGLERTLNNFKDNPKMQSKIKLMADVYKDLKNVPRGTIKEKEESLKKALPPTNIWDALERGYNKLVKGSYNTELSRLIASPHWDKELLKLKDIKDANQRAKKFLDILAKVGTKETPLELELTQYKGVE